MAKDFEIRLDIDKALEKKLKSTSTAAVKAVVRQNGSELQEKMMRQTKTAFRKGYSHGDTARSITLDISDDGLTATVGPKTAYAPYVEYGTRFMDAEPFVRPALDKQGPEFRKDLEKMVK